MRPRHSERWDIPPSIWPEAREARQILAIVCLAEQRFMVPFLEPHLNASMFHIIGQTVEAKSDYMAVTYRRRGAVLSVGGRRFSNTIFQQPAQIEETRCRVINKRLLKALLTARSRRPDIWSPIQASLDAFLLGHAEHSELSWETCVMLSAMAFEQLMAPKETTAVSLASSFADLWAAHISKRIDIAVRVKADPKYAADQQSWPLHRKWMKELYEARSASAHRGARIGFSQNWQPAQHVVIAAFAFALTLKLRLSAAKLYDLSDEELGACDALDLLLDSDWGESWKRAPEWSTILTQSELMRGISASVSHAYQAMQDGKADNSQ
jgi:hypothetical protein